MSSRPATATLLVSCRDRKGIVAALAQVLYGHGANIIDADQHSDAGSAMFFQRICFDASELHTDRVSLERGIAEVATRFEMSLRLAWGDRRAKMAIFVSKYDHCLYDLLLRHRSGELDCDIPLVIGNHPDLAPVARHFGLQLAVVPVDPSGDRAHERAQLELLESSGVDLVVLARYMQILSPDLVRRYPSRIINIHHSFLPAFVGAKPYHQAHERGVKVIGATAHYVTEDLDEGPIIAQDVIRTSHRDSIEELVRKGRDVERVVLSRAVRAHLEHRVLTHGRRTVVFE